MRRKKKPDYHEIARLELETGVLPSTETIELIELAKKLNAQPRPSAPPNKVTPDKPVQAPHVQKKKRETARDMSDQLARSVTPVNLGQITASSFPVSSSGVLVNGAWEKRMIKLRPSIFGPDGRPLRYEPVLEQ